MLRQCVRDDIRALRKLERHNTWLQQHIPSRNIQQQRKRQVLELRTELCLRLGCSGDRIKSVIDQHQR